MHGKGRNAGGNVVDLGPREDAKKEVKETQQETCPDSPERSRLKLATQYRSEIALFAGSIFAASRATNVA